MDSSARRQAHGGESVEVLGVRVSHPEKLLWPDDGISKLDLVRYYERAAPIILKYVAHRPLTLRPFPRGVDRPGFYLKHAPKGAPPWLETFRDVAESTGEPVDFVVATDARALIWAAQYNAIEVHPWLSRVDQPDFPDWAVVDLDPPDNLPDAARWDMLVGAAGAVRQRLDGWGLRGFPKLTGQTGLHVLVPLARVHRYEAVRAFCQALARELSERRPDLLTADYDVADRRGRILVDYAQNARGKSTVAPYSVRPRPGAPVAVPVTWEEVGGPDLRHTRWTLRTVFERLDRVGDPLEPALALPQRLPTNV